MQWLGVENDDWGLSHVDPLRPKSPHKLKNLNRILREGFSFAIVFEHDKIFEHNVNNFPRWELNSAGKHANLNLLIVFKLFSSESIRTERRPTCKTRQENIFGRTLQYKKHFWKHCNIKTKNIFENIAILIQKTF